ncbi:MAG: replication-associated recombination protein A [Bacilli bacterium]|nr:replication-associated recombination protein A [Bacilli bacterium]
MEPLAFALRPNTLDDIVGQTHLVGPNGAIRKMINNNHITSMILFGNPGIGKTTLANVIVKMLDKKSDTYNASSDNKEKLKKISEKDKKDIIIVDEIHRMKKDIQDYLLPFVERGDVIMIGITTINPYRAVNPAIRSRATVYKLMPLSNNDLTVLVNKAIAYYQSFEYNKDFNIEKEAIDYIVSCANGEGRATINMVEAIYFATANTLVTLQDVKDIILKPSLDYDKNGDGYYDTLSGLHKSIRGSDVNASLHYLAKLLYTEDLVPLCRRLYCICYEDISLANPQMGPKVYAACQAALDLGMPEARLPLASIVVDMALSPKSNTTLLAIDKALSDIEKGNSGNLPKHLRNVYAYDDDNPGYKYPHNYPGSWVNQQYLPDKIKDVIYYEPKDSSKYEEALKERYEAILKAQGKKTN